MLFTKEPQLEEIKEKKGDETSFVLEIEDSNVQEVSQSVKSETPNPKGDVKSETPNPKGDVKSETSNPKGDVKSETSNPKGDVKSETPNPKDLKKEPSDSVRFDPSVPDSPLQSDTALNRALEVPKDETIRLFDCMPKGFENFLESGPTRRVEDHVDYEKLSKTEVKRKEYLSEQKEPQADRAIDSGEKGLELQHFIESYDPFIAEYTRKEVRAKELYAKDCQAVKDLTAEVPRRVKQLEDLKRVRDKMIARVTKYEEVDTLIERIIKASDSQFSDFTSMIDRHSTLVATNNYLMKRYVNRHQYEQKLNDDRQAYKDFAKHHQMFLRKQVSKLKLDLDHLTRSNLDREQECHEWSKMAAQRIVSYCDMTMGIQNMARSLMEIRPFTKCNLEYATDTCMKIETIGILMKDYISIVKEGGAKRVRKRRKSPFDFLKSKHITLKKDSVLSVGQAQEIKSKNGK